MGSDPPYGKGPSVANLVHKRVSTDQQSTTRQDLVLQEAAHSAQPLARTTRGMGRRSRHSQTTAV